MRGGVVIVVSGKKPTEVLAGVTITSVTSIGVDV